VGGVKRESRLMQVVQRKTGRASSFNASSPITLRVVAGMPFAFGFDPLDDFEFVGELKHRFSSFWK
jgi:hypothetical protein